MARTTGSAPVVVRRSFAALTIALILIASVALQRREARAATFTVTTTLDAGAGSLRAAIEAANAAPGADTILFRIPTTDPGFAGGVFTIRPLSELPAVQGPTLLDGYSQTAFTGNTNPAGPEIVLNGALAGDAAGIQLSAPNSVLRGLVVNGFGTVGVVVAGDCRVEGCYLGTDAAGNAAVPNGGGNGLGSGLWLGGDGNRIGGTEARARNVISGNAHYGIFSSGGKGNVLVGNHIGTNAAGDAAVPNEAGGVFLQNVHDTRIGGTEVGSRNVISGNGGDGLLLEGGNNNLIQGNYIGANALGNAAVPNEGDGVLLTQTSGVLVGGTASAARNVISGNREDGVEFVHTGANRLQGNYIGLNAAGTAALPNGENGVNLADSSGHLIGGTERGARNVISGNSGHGISVIHDAGDIRIQGNYIGTNPVGRASIPNQGHGVRILDGSQSIQVGGTSAGAGNLISGNAGDGVHLSGETVFDPLPPPTAFNVVQGNLIGTDAGGDAAIPNQGNGVSLQDGEFAGVRENAIGGTAAGARNLISGNDGHGIALFGNATEENWIAGNFIGTRAGGTSALPNGGHGVSITSGAHRNRIGGDTAEARNVISGNRNDGVALDSAGALNRLEGNYIGTNVHGSGALPNESGVSVFSVFAETVIGGDVPGVRNVISGNRRFGIAIENASGCRMQGNFIGVNALGTGAVANGNDGISIGNAADHQIGGTTPGERNLISGNRGDGVNIARGSDQVVVEGNYIGVNLTGSGAVPNGGYGVVLFEAGPNTVGGTAVGAGNLISGNLRGGVWLADGATGNELQGNFIGTNAAGTLALPNGGHGVEIANSSQNRIGGAAAGAGNLISGNLANGVLIRAFELSPSVGNEILGNRIGTNAAGAGPLPNNAYGVELTHNDVRENRIGGTDPGEGNRIAFNRRDGVLLRVEAPADTLLVANPIRANSIHGNGGLGINLQPAGEPPSTVTPNDPQDPDPGPNRLQNFPILTGAVVQPGITTLTGTLNSTPDSTFALDFFRSDAADPSGFGEGGEYLGSAQVVTDGSGNAGFVFSITGPGGGTPGFFTATATNVATQDTGEFGPALAGSLTPIEAPTFAARGLAFATGLAAGGYSCVGTVISTDGSGMEGVRVSLHPVAGPEVYSSDWDPNRLQVTRTDARGSFRFVNLARGRYQVLAYLPGRYFTPRAYEVELGPNPGAEVTFTVGGVDTDRPMVTVNIPLLGTAPTTVTGTVSDPGGAGVRAVLVRLRATEPFPVRTRRLDWLTGIWSEVPAASQTRWALLDGTGKWSLDLPPLGPGEYALEVQACDWAGNRSPRRVVPLRPSARE